jgi:hypothetical protein
MSKEISVCVYCANKSREPCFECKKEGKYRQLEPAALFNWEFPPDLPSMREMVDLPPAERLAMMWLALKYQEIEKRKGDV